MVSLKFQTVTWSNDPKQIGATKTLVFNSVTGEKIELDEKDVRNVLQTLSTFGTFKPEFVRIGKRLQK